MKNLLFGLVLVLIATSCGKWNGDKRDKRLVYYAEDFKEINSTILDIPTSEIDAVWAEFNVDENKIYNSYALIVESDGKLTKEVGSCAIDWNNQITFVPSSGKTYEGKWIFEKEKYTISFEGKLRNEELTFIYKDIDKCKF